MDKEKDMIELEIRACKENIEFYASQIDDMEEKLAELEKVKKGYEFY